MAGGFQTQVYNDIAPGLPGDFASHNPRWNLNAGPGGLIAGPKGLTSGRFSWVSAVHRDWDGFPADVNNFGSGPVAGFIGREHQGLLTAYLQESGGIIPAGFPVTVYTGGDFWALNDGATQARPGMYAYASFADGKVSFAAAGAAGSAAVTGSIAAGTGVGTASISGDVMTVSALSSGTFVAGGPLSGTGVTTGTRVVSQLTGAAGGVGTYRVDIPQTAASTTITETYGVFTVTAGTGVGVGQTLSGSGVTAGTTVTQLGTGTGGSGTYYVDTTQTATSTTVTAATSVQTKWVCQSIGGPGEVVKITTHVPG